MNFKEYAKSNQTIICLELERVARLIELAGNPGDGKLPVYILTADAVPLFDAMAGAVRRGADVVCIRTSPQAGTSLPALPDGILDIVLEPGCDIGARLGEML